jgi:hypothetical protein
VSYLGAWGCFRKSLIEPIMGYEEDVDFVSCVGARACGLRRTNNHTDYRASRSDGDLDNGGADNYGSSDHNDGSGHDDDDGGSNHDHDGGSDHDDGGSDHYHHDAA